MSISYKVILLGNGGVGKTSIISRYCFDSFTFHTSPSSIATRARKKISCGDQIVTIEIWDTYGQEIFKSLSNAIFHGAYGALLVYDITSIESFDALEGWMQDLKQKASPDCVIILIGNKSDLRTEENQETTVSTDRGLEFAKQNGFAFLETSAFSSENIEKAFVELAERIHGQKSLAVEQPATASPPFKLPSRPVEPSPQKRKKKCC